MSLDRGAAHPPIDTLDLEFNSLHLRDENSEENDEDLETEFTVNLREEMREHVDLTRDFADCFKYHCQIQFGDTKTLEVLEREGSKFLHLARCCLEKNVSTPQTASSDTWEVLTTVAMRFRPSPLRG